MSGWRSAWRSLRKAAGMPSFRIYDLRRQFVTEPRDSGVPESVIRELAGHVDPQRMVLYSHPRLAAQRLALEALAVIKVGQSEGSYVTKALPLSSSQNPTIANKGESGRGARI